MEIKRTVYRDDHEMLRETARRFFERECLPRQAQWDRDGLVDRETWLKAGRDGLLCVTVPEEYGGGGGDFGHSAVLAEEYHRSGISGPSFSVHSDITAPYIVRLGTEAQKREWLPPICRGEKILAIAMTEPGTGSDLKSIRTTAVRDGDDFIINGSKTFISNGLNADMVGRKIWTTNAHHCHYMIALVRSSGAPEDRQKGLSQFIVDLSLPGVNVRPIVDLTGDAHFSEVTFDDVFLADGTLIGNEGGGWEQVTAELAFERSGPERIYSSIVLIDCWAEHLRRHGASDADTVLLGSFATQLATLRSLSVAVTARLARGESPVVEAALVKDIGTEFEQAIPALLEAAIAADPGQEVDAELYRTVAYLSQISPTFSLRGGTREVLRGMIARGLGLR